MIVKRNLYLRIMALILVCAMMLSSCSVLEELLDESVLNENASPPEENTTSAGTEEDTAAPEEYENAVHSSAKAGDSGTAILIFEDVAGVDGAFTVKNEGVTVDKIEVKNKKGILCDIYDGSGDMKIFAYDNRAQLNTFTVTVYYMLSENANGTYIIEFDGETSDETGKELTKQKINIVITVESAACEHKDDNPADHNCDACGEAMSECADNNRDHKCDMCGTKLTECADGDSNHKCDMCGTKLTECADGDSNHKCDMCGTKLTECTDADSNHKCDMCGNTLTNCVDGNSDDRCDICGVVLGNINYSTGLSYSVNSDGETCTITGIGVCTDVDLVIPPTIDGYRVTVIGNSAFMNCVNILSVTISEGITSIEKYAFMSCAGMSSITIPASVTSIKPFTFPICYNLTNIIVDDNNTNYVSIDGNLYSKDGTKLVQYAVGKNDESFIIREGVSCIGNGAFYGAKNLIEVTIPNGVTVIEDFAFQACSNISSITIPNSVATIAQRAFEGCGNLVSINFMGSKAQWQSISFVENWDLDTGRYTVYYSVVDTCDNCIDKNKDGKCDVCTAPIEKGDYSTGLSYSVNSDGKTCTITGIGTCTDTDLIIPPVIDGYTVTSIAMKAFENCVNIKSVIIPNGVTNIGPSAFYECTGLLSVTIPNTVTTISQYAFSKCESLVGITIPDSVTSIGDCALNFCSSLTSVVIPDSVTTFGMSVFGKCTNLKSVKLPKNINVIGNFMFMDCVNLESVTMPEKLTTIEQSAFLRCSKLTSINIPNSVYTIGNNVFRGCSSLTSINMAGTKIKWDSISKGTDWNLDTAEYIIYCTDGNICKNCVDNNSDHYCDGCGAILENVNYSTGLSYSVNSDGETCTITGIGTCEDTDIYIPEYIDGYRVTSIGDHAFYYCSKLININIPDSVTSIGDYAFYSCSSLTSITIPEGVTSIGDEAFFSCFSLTSINIPDSVTSIGDCAFVDCINLSAINVDINNPQYYSEQNCIIERSTKKLILGCKNSIIPWDITSIERAAFYGCTSLTSITIPDGVTSIGDLAFRYCSSLTSINIPNSVAFIGDYAFSYCTSLTSITIPNSVTSIGGSAFDNCSSLTSINYNGSIADWEQISKDSNWDMNTGNYTVYSTDGEIVK